MKCNIFLIYLYIWPEMYQLSWIPWTSISIFFKKTYFLQLFYSLAYNLIYYYYTDIVIFDRSIWHTQYTRHVPIVGTK